DELRAFWAFRLEALRAYVERGVELEALADGEQHLLADTASAEAAVLGDPRDVHAALERAAAAAGEVVLSSRAPYELVTLRFLAAVRTPTIIEARLTPAGAGCRVELAQRGFSAE